MSFITKKYFKGYQKYHTELNLTGSLFNSFIPIKNGE